MSPETKDVLVYLSTQESSTAMAICVSLERTCDKVMDSIIFLRDHGYVQCSESENDYKNRISVDTPLFITAEGREALYEMNRQAKHNFWITARSWVSIGIAFLSLIISIVALLQ